MRTFNEEKIPPIMWVYFACNLFLRLYFLPKAYGTKEMPLSVNCYVIAMIINIMQHIRYMTSCAISFITSV
jgi:bacteriorhodopsin